MLNRNILNKYNKACSAKEKLEDKIYNHFRIVLKVIYDCFDEKLPNWIWFSGAPEGSCGSPDLQDDDIYYEYEYGPRGDMPEVITEEYDYSGSVPREFLFIDLEKVKTIILAQLKRQNEINEKIYNKKAKNKTIIREAKKKLTKEERAALGIK